MGQMQFLRHVPAPGQPVRGGTSWVLNCRKESNDIMVYDNCCSGDSVIIHNLIIPDLWKATGPFAFDE